MVPLFISYRDLRIRFYSDINKGDELNETSRSKNRKIKY